MKQIGIHNYFVYITTNKERTVLYTGVTNSLRTRLSQHQIDSEESKKHFAEKYNCINLIYWERHTQIEDAIKRETKIKGWTRSKKERLINGFNPEWKFLNEELW